MNPFMMMFGPIGFGFMGGGCSCGVNMPYYGMDDRLTFMNFPVFRNTSMDYLLDPRLAMMQSQQSMMNGYGNIFGSTMLPMFNNFPGMNFPGMNNNSPWSPWFQPSKTETEEERKEREAREAEAKKPEAKKAEALKNTFDKIKKLADADSEYLTLDKSIIDKANEAMKKEKAEDRLQAMKEVIALIPDEQLKIAIYSDEKIRKHLRIAGFNFECNDVKNKDVQSGDADNIYGLTTLHDELQRKEYNKLQVICGQLNTKEQAKDIILSVISNWNDKFHSTKDKGLLRWIGENLPTGNDEIAKKDTVSADVLIIVQALEAKASEYKGCAKVEKALQDLLKAKEAMIKNFNKNTINNVATAFDNLYARLRMQEAVKVNDLIRNNADFKEINEAKADFINEDLVVEETIEDLKSEGITAPKVSDLDEAKKPTVVTVSTEGVVNIDTKYEGKSQELVNEYLVKEKHILTQVGDTDVYQTKDYDGKGSGVRYFSVQNDKLIEVTKKEDGTFVAAPNAKTVTRKEIEAYDSTVQRINKLINEDKSIVPVENTSNLFKATGADEYYALVDNNFGRVKSSVNNIKAAELKADDLEDFDDTEVKSKDKVEKDKKDKAAKEKQGQIDKVVAKLTNEKYIWRTLNYKLNELGLEKTKVIGYFKTTGQPTVYFKYDNNPNSNTYQKLLYLRDVTSIDSNGYMTKNNGTKEACLEVQTAKESAEDLYDVLSKVAYKYPSPERRLSSEEIQEDLALVERKFNSFKKYTTIHDVIDFVTTFNEGSTRFWQFWKGSEQHSISSSVVNNYAIPESKKEEYVKFIAIRINQIVDRYQLVFDDPDDKITLEQIAKGNKVTFNYESVTKYPDKNEFAGLSIKTTACELDRIIDLFLKKYYQKRTEQASQSQNAQ